MADKPILLGISGSLRAASSNTLLVKEAARAFGDCEFQLGDIRFPLYDGDLEASEGVPQAVMTLSGDIKAADAVVVSTPEYNKALPGVLKNALDWLSRTGEGPFEGKPVAVLSSAAGRSGGERAQYSLRHCLTPLGARVLPKPEVMIAGASGAFDEGGRLKDPASYEFLQKLMQALRAEASR